MRWLVLMVLVALPRASYANEPLRTLVHVSTPDAMDERQLRLFDASLRYEVKKREGVAPILQPPADSTGEPCPDQRVSCLTQLADGLGADELVLANAANVGHARVLTLKRLRIQTAEITASVTRQMSASSSEAYLMILGGAVAELYESRPLRPETEVGIPRAVVQRWQPQPLPSWSVWAGAGATTTAFAAGIVMGVLAHESEQELQRLTEREEVIPGAEVRRLNDEATSRALTANVLYGVAAGLALTTVVLWLFSDMGDDEAAFAELGLSTASIKF